MRRRRIGRRLLALLAICGGLLAVLAGLYEQSAWWAAGADVWALLVGVTAVALMGAVQVGTSWVLRSGARA